MTDSTEYEIRVHGGVQQGASRKLNAFDSLLIGNTLDCDIYFDDHHGADRRLELLRSGRNITVVLLRGEALLEETPMEHGKSYKLFSNQRVTLGKTEFSLDSIESELSDRTNNNRTHTSSAPVAINKNAATRLAVALQKPVSVLLLVSFAVIGTATAAFNSGTVSPAIQITEKATVSDIEFELEQLSVGALSIDRMPENKIIIYGVINNVADQRKLQAAMAQRSEDIVIKTVIADDVVSSVKEVFRAYGLEIDISKLKPGRVAVRTETDDLENLASAEAAATSDVYGLLELNVINTIPEKQAAPAAPNQHAEDAGQSIRMMIYGDPSYVVTEDQSIFYTGALLPNGYRINAIQQDSVILSKDGSEFRLNM